jgi:hypothetical protein
VRKLSIGLQLYPMMAALEVDLGYTAGPGFAILGTHDAL